MKLGAHISTAKPFSDAPLRAAEIGCECMQIFVNPPQRWNPVAIPEEEIARYKQNIAMTKIAPVIIHSIYLVNLASDNPFYYSASIASLIDDLKKAKAIGAIGTAVHIGSTKGRELDEVLPKVATAIKEVLAATDQDVDFVIENSAGAGNIIGDAIEEIAKIIQSVNSSRVKVLLDTAHAFESGYDLSTAQGVSRWLENFEREIGLEQLVGFHLNDSKTDFNSKRDRHADIGKGLLGEEAFKYLLQDPKLGDKFGILETPQDETSWAEQLKYLKSLRDQA